MALTKKVRSLRRLMTGGSRMVPIEGGWHDREPRIGDVEFYTHAQCPDCGWRCAIPGEGMNWPACPHGCRDEAVLPQRGKSFDDPPFSLGLIALTLREVDALEPWQRTRKRVYRRWLPRRKP